MISRIEGILIQKKPPLLELNVNGLYYEILAPMGTFYGLTDLQSRVLLFTHLVIREDAHQLYGFTTAHERDLFRTLIKINGVGPKLGLTILSGMSAEQFFECVSLEDADQLVRIPGIGKKTAQRLLIEIKDKLKDLDMPFSDQHHDPTTHHAPSASTDALAALTALGYKPKDAQKALKAIDKEHQDSEQMIKDALQWLTQGAVV